MERVTFSHPTVRETSEKFVPILLNSDIDEHASRVMIHRVKDLPTVIFFSPTGTRLFELPYRARFDPGATERMMRRALEHDKQSRATEDKLLRATLEAPKSLEARDALEAFYREGFRYADALDQARQGYQQALEAGKGGDDKRMSELLFYELKLRRFGEAGKAIEAFTQRYPDSPYRERVEYYRGLQTFHGKSDIDGAAKIWQEQVERWPNGKWTGKGKGMLYRSRLLQKDRERYGEAFPKDSKRWGGR